jgi:hypothetical protein
MSDHPHTSGMADFASNEDYVDLDSLRERLRKMTDEELIRWGEAAHWMCKPSFEQSPRKCFAIQLEEAIAEW